MKILVPTDFSKYANYAFDVALKLAIKTRSELHLFHASDVPEDWENLPPEAKYNDKINKSIALYARNEMQALKDKAAKSMISCEYHYEGGKLLKHFPNLVNRLKIDLVTMGSHGVSGKEEWFIGSNTQKVVRKIRKNVLVVKNPIANIDVKNVAFVSSLHKDDQKAFRHFLDFISVFDDVNLHVLSIDTLGWYSQPGLVVKKAFEEFKDLATGYNCKTQFYPDYSVDAGIRHFTEDNDIELVGISNHNRHPVKRFFQGSNVEMLINHSDVPVLSIDYAKT